MIATTTRTAEPPTRLGAKDSVIVLSGIDPATKRVRWVGSDFSIWDKAGNCVEGYRFHTEPEGWRSSPHMAGYWHPAHWLISYVLVGANGKRWSSDDSMQMVCDDFGTLVEVPA